MAMQSKYRSGVGMLLYLIKYLRSDLANVVREVSKCMDGASLASYEDMQRVIKFVLDTKLHSLKLQPRHENDTWDLLFYCNSDWAGDPESRISVTGFIMYMLGVKICWRSKAQKGVTLSSSEAEYVAMLEVVKEIRFIFNLLRSMFIEVKLPIIVRCDNVGAILWPKIQVLEFVPSMLTPGIILFVNALGMISSNLFLLRLVRTTLLMSLLKM
jgi:hypothetical protein